MGFTIKYYPNTDFLKSQDEGMNKFNRIQLKVKLNLEPDKNSDFFA